MMRSMFSGVSGLRVHQTKMDVIGNNIANVNTTAFKSSRVTFNEVFSQTLQGASGPSENTGRGGRNPMQIGLGTNVSSIDTLMTTGAAQRTDNPFDLMIEGDGFFVVGDSTGTYFTRAGVLRKDDDGNLVIPNGMKVYGWNTVETDPKTGAQSVIRGPVGPLQLDTPENMTAEPAATGQIRVDGNINQTDGIDANGIKMQVQFYDSLGNLFSGSLIANYDSTNATWSVQALDEENNPGTTLYFESSDGKIGGRATITEGSIQFATSGEIDRDAGGDLLVENVLIDGASVEFCDPVDAKVTPGTPPLTSINTNSAISDIEINLENLTQYNAKTNIDPIMIDGREPGTLQGYDIGPDGIITASYSNGDTKILGQIVTANFRNPAGLQKAGNNLFTATPNSGDFDGIGEEGNFQGGVLEMSNVDLSKEFTEMITTQRGFQANSRIITSSDEMLQELVNLKR